MQITIKALTETGTSALRQHLKECKKLELRNKALFSAIGKQKVITEEPLTVSLKISILNNNPYFVKGVSHEIITALTSNGAECGKDYVIEVD